MDASQLNWLSATDAARAVQDGAVSAEQMVAACLARIRESERNRPASLRGAAGRPVGEGVALIGATLTADEVAARTLRAVRDGELYVITHPEGLEPLRRRFKRMEGAIARAAAATPPPA